MGLRGAFNDPELRALEGKWVKLVVGPFEYSITEVSKDTADAWWDAIPKPDVGVPNLDLETKDLRDIENMLDLSSSRPSGEEIKAALDAAIPAYGGKASHFGAFPHMDNEIVPYPKAFAIPVYYYWQFMEDNGFNAMVEEMLADSEFQDDAQLRDESLEALRDSMMEAPLDSAFEDLLFTKLNAEYSGVRMRFRSSTNAEDLDGFTGAGLYTSKSGWSIPTVRDAIREVWSSVWYFRAFEERSYRNIDHTSVGMALLVHRSFPDEEANGVAITGNIYDPLGVEPGFYVNVQKGDLSVVLPDSGVTTDQFLYHYDMPGQPVVYMGHSNQVPDSTTVLTTTQIHDLGTALKEIHEFFMPRYGSEPGVWYAMDTEFKFDQTLDDPDGDPVLFMKQARPYPGLNSSQ
jgi:hypothetical protein